MSQSRGAVLVVAMIFLLLLALVATTVMQTSLLEFQMAGNDQFREVAFQQSQAIATALSNDLVDVTATMDNTVGYTICKTGSANPDCDEDITATLPSDLTTVPSGVTLDYWVERQAPADCIPLPFRVSEEETSSAIDWAIYEVEVQYDGSDARLGNAKLAQGVAVRC